MRFVRQVRRGGLVLLREKCRCTPRKREKKLTWDETGKAIGRSPVYAAMLLYGYGQASEEEG